MASIRRLVARLLTSFRSARAEDELARDVASHLALIEDEFRRRGMTPEEARFAARRVFGGIDQAKERHRDVRSFMWIEYTVRDVTYAVRILRRSPGFAVGATLSL